MKIVVAGTGYVGLSISVLLAQNNEVWAVDTDPQKVDMINKRLSPIADDEIEDFLVNKNLFLKATMDDKAVFKDAEFIIIATPTNYDPYKGYFDTSSIESVIDSILKHNTKAIIVIKSTVPVGYTNTLIEKYQYTNFLFCPEFLREGRALYDNLYPSRIVVGADLQNGKMRECARIFTKLLIKGAVRKEAPVLLINLTEAEAVKLFANTYLAMRVGFFNELDMYAEQKGLNPKQIIDGMCLDPRIGKNYNNPSFGYGGYCLPKDSKQMLANYEGIPNNLIQAIVETNDTRKQYITNRILERMKRVKEKQKYTVGVYRLTMKEGSDNFRKSSVLEIMDQLAACKGVGIIIYEPIITEGIYKDYRVVNDLSEFKEDTDIIIANRCSAELADVLEKVYSRDIYYCN